METVLVCGVAPGRSNAAIGRGRGRSASFGHYHKRTVQTPSATRLRRCCTPKAGDGILLHRREERRPKHAPTNDSEVGSHRITECRRRDVGAETGTNGRRVSRRWAAHRPLKGR